jgi:hypothetical protein
VVPKGAIGACPGILVAKALLVGPPPRALQSAPWKKLSKWKLFDELFLKVEELLQKTKGPQSQKKNEKELLPTSLICFPLRQTHIIGEATWEVAFPTNLGALSRALHENKERVVFLDKLEPESKLTDEEPY